MQLPFSGWGTGIVVMLWHARSACPPGRCPLADLLARLVSHHDCPEQADYQE